MDYLFELKRLKKANKSYRKKLCKRHGILSGSVDEMYKECVKYLEDKIANSNTVRVGFGVDTPDVKVKPSLKKPKEEVIESVTEPVVGEVFSETQFYTLEEPSSRFGRSGYSSLRNLETDETISVSTTYLDKYLSSANQFKTVEKVSRSSMIDKIKENPLTAMSVKFLKKTDVDEVVNRIFKNVKMGFIFRDSGFGSKDPTESDIKKIIKKELENSGEVRVLKGYTKGVYDNSGRIYFTDLEAPMGSTRFRTVDPRTISELIVNEVKYILK